MKNNGRGAPSMNPSEVAACLAVLKPRFLDGLTPRDSSSIVAAATTRQFSANSVMANQGHPPDRLFLLLTGRARLFYTTEDGRKILLLWVPPGECCGGAALVSRSSDYLASTEAVEDTWALVWDRKTIRQLAERYPRLLENALSIAFDYLAFYRATHVSLTCHNARQRLAHVLASLASGIGKKVPGGLELNVRNEELANEANVTLFTASRLLNEWQRMGIVEKSRGKVLVRSPERLSSRIV
jgi:CRP-like cAMP-binding protein